MIPLSSSSSGPISIAVEVGEVAELPQPAGGRFRAPFSVVFHGPPEPVLPQGMYRLENEQFGGTELFLVPIGPEVAQSPDRPTAMRYQAVFG